MNVREISKRLCGCRILEGLEGEALLPCVGHRQAVMAAIEDPETSYTPVVRRRLASGRKAMEVSIMDEPKSLVDVEGRMETIADGIRALQSLDDLGEEMNHRLSRMLDELQSRHQTLSIAREKMLEWKKR